MEILWNLPVPWQVVLLWRNRKYLTVIVLWRCHSRTRKERWNCFKQKRTRGILESGRIFWYGCSGNRYSAMKVYLMECRTFVTKNSTVVIASAPSFNFGLVDEIEEISDFCKTYNLYLRRYVFRRFSYSLIR